MESAQATPAGVTFFVLGVTKPFSLAVLEVHMALSRLFCMAPVSPVEPPGTSKQDN